MNISRRSLLLGTAAFAGCDGASRFIHNLSKRMNLSTLSKDEQSWLYDEAARRHAHGDAPLTFKNRVLTIDAYLRDRTLADVNFIDCSFVHHMMFDVNLRNINFVGCDFSNVRWDRGHWEKVAFNKCYLEGNGIQMAIASGSDSLFENCQFHGTEPPKDQSQDTPGWYGEISAPGHARFLNCDFNRTSINTDASVNFQNCTFSRVIANPYSEEVTHDFVMNECSAEHTLIIGDSDIWNIRIKDSSLEGLALGGTRSKKIELNNVICGLGIDEATFDHFIAKKTTFVNTKYRQKGATLWLNSTQANTVEFIDCDFPGENPRIHGEPDKLDLSPNVFNGPKVAPPPTRITTLRFKNTRLPSLNFNQAVIHNLELDHLDTRDASFKQAQIDKIKLKDVTLSGTWDFTDGGSVREVIKENVKQSPKFNLLRGKAEDVAL